MTLEIRLKWQCLLVCLVILFTSANIQSLLWVEKGKECRKYQPAQRNISQSKNRYQVIFGLLVISVPVQVILSKIKVNKLYIVVDSFSKKTGMREA